MDSQKYNYKLSGDQTSAMMVAGGRKRQERETWVWGLEERRKRPIFFWCPLIKASSLFCTRPGTSSFDKVRIHQSQDVGRVFGGASGLEGRRWTRLMSWERVSMALTPAVNFPWTFNTRIEWSPGSSRGPPPASLVSARLASVALSASHDSVIGSTPRSPTPRKGLA